MFTIHNLYEMKELPKWSEISLPLYKDFSIQDLFSKTFRYYFVNGTSIDIEFREGAMRHLWGIHHIDRRIKSRQLFQKIDEGLDLVNIAKNKSMKKRLNDNRDRIRAFACIYDLLKNGDTFWVDCGKLKGTEIEVDYLKSKNISSKGVNLGMRTEGDICVPITMLIDRAIDPNKTIRGLMECLVARMEILENGKVIENIYYNYAAKLKRNKRNGYKNEYKKILRCFRKDIYSEKLKRMKLKTEVK